jgi:alkylation response protein AidB-like acyl-CoA dehydrogenase
MTILTESPKTLHGVLDAVRELAPTIASRAAEIETARRIPRDLLDELITAGCFRLLLPTSHGGMSADLPSALRVLETLARADASVGWTVMIGSASWCDLVGLPRESFDGLFATGADVIFAGAINPSGSISAVGDGYRVSGRWGFASGCEHADWIFADCVEGVIDGVPQLRIAVVPAGDVVIEDTWRVSGLCGTGSHHFRIDDLVVPRERTYAFDDHEPCLDAPIVHIPVPSLAPLAAASVAMGIAQGALDDIVALAVEKVPLLAAGPLAANPLFQFDLATADTELRAARALVYETAEAAWHTAVGATSLTLEERARIRAAGVWATERAVAVVTTAYRAGGGTALYEDCPLQRRLRDVNAVTQHFLLRRDTMTTAGAVLAGQEIHVPVF